MTQKPCLDAEVDYAEYRTILYFNKYKYKARIYLYGVELLTYMDVNEIASHERIHYDLSKLKKYFDSLIKFKEMLVQKIHKIKIQKSVATVYGNDLSELLDLKNLFPDVMIKYTQVIPIVTKTDNTIFTRRKPKKQYRVYMRTCRTDKEFKTKFFDFIFQNPDFKLSTKFQKYMLKFGYTYFLSSFYIEFDDPKNLMVLSLKFGDYLGKNYKLEKLEI